jgi:hypothetical protein
MSLSGLFNFSAFLLYLKKNLQLAAATCPGEVLTKSEARQSEDGPSFLCSIVDFPTTGFELLLDKMAEITYFLDAKLFFYISLLTISDFGIRISPLKAGLMGAKWLRRGQRSFGCIPSVLSAR